MAILGPVIHFVLCYSDIKIQTICQSEALRFAYAPKKGSKDFPDFSETLPMNLWVVFIPFEISD